MKRGKEVALALKSSVLEEGKLFSFLEGVRQKYFKWFCREIKHWSLYFQFWGMMNCHRKNKGRRKGYCRNTVEFFFGSLYQSLKDDKVKSCPFTLGKKNWHFFGPLNYFQKKNFFDYYSWIQKVNLWSHGREGYFINNITSRIQTENP